MHKDPIAFANDWADAWNAHDIERVLAHFHEDATFSSPFAARIRAGIDGRVAGEANIRAYWTKGLAAVPDLHFKVEAVFAGVDHIVILYNNQKGVRVSEILKFKGDLVIESHGTYPPDILNPTGARD